MFGVYLSWNLNSFSSFKQYSFPAKVSERVWEIMLHPLYCLTQDSGFIFDNTNAIYFSTPPTPLTLANRPVYARWRTIMWMETIFQNSCKWLVLDFGFYMSHFIHYFIKQNSKKGNYYFLNVFNRISTTENYYQNKQLDSEMQLFVTFCLGELDLKSFIRDWELAWNEWMNENL